MRTGLVGNDWAWTLVLASDSKAAAMPRMSVVGRVMRRNPSLFGVSFENSCIDRGSRAASLLGGGNHGAAQSGACDCGAHHAFRFHFVGELADKCHRLLASFGNGDGVSFGAPTAFEYLLPR